MIKRSVVGSLAGHLSIRIVNKARTAYIRKSYLTKRYGLGRTTPLQFSVNIGLYLYVEN